MNTMGILKDSLRYSLSDWKKILVLGIIIIVSNIVGIISVGTTNMDIISLLIGIGFIFGFLVNGYMFKVVRISLNGKNDLPKFKNWIDMGADGAKVFIIFIVYLILPSLIIIFLSPITYDEPFLSLSDFISILGNMGITPLDAFINLMGSIIWPQIFNSIFICFNAFIPGGIYAIIYMIIIIPIFLVAIANMAYYEGEFKSAFKFREIFEEISLIGWFNLIKWYILIGIIFLSIESIYLIIGYISFFLIHTAIIQDIILGLLISFTLVPYSYVLIARIVALFYMPDEDSIIIEEESTDHRHIY